MLIIKAKFSRVLDHAENPAETLDYSYEQQLRQLQNVKRGIADVATAKKRLEMQYTTMQQQAEKLDGQAKEALKANREDLAREALTRKAAIQGQLDGIMQSGQQLEAQQSKLVESEKALSMKIESFRTQKEVIKAQYSAAEAQVRIGEAATGISSQMSDVGLAVERAKDKTQSMQARADAINELTEAGALEDFTSSGDAIDRQLKQIQQSGQVDDDLAKLKAELGSGAAAPAIEAAEDATATPAPASGSLFAADAAPGADAEPAEEDAAPATPTPAKPAPRSRAKKTTDAG
jgi:phage shock protein A